MATPPFVPTHTVPASGTRAWATPDGSGEPAARLDPGLAVQVVERTGDWAKVRCANDWEAWVDGRRLVDLVADAEDPAAPPAGPPSGPPAAEAPTGPPPGPAGAEPAPAAAPAATATATLVDVEPTAPAPAAASPAGIEIRGLSLVSLLGAIAMAGGSFLDWWKLGPVGVTAWDIPVKYLLTGKAGDGFDVGPIVVLLALVVASTLLIGRRLPDLVLLVVSALAIGIGLAAVVRGVTNDPTAVYPEVGLLVTMGGGALVAIDGFGLVSGRH